MVAESSSLLIYIEPGSVQKKVSFRMVKGLLSGNFCSAILLTICEFGATKCIKAQTPSSVLNAVMRVESRYSEHRPPVLSVQADKDVFNLDETIQPSCLVLDRGADSVAGTALRLALMHPAIGTVVAQRQFDMVGGGFSNGALTLPDTTANGQYEFVPSTTSIPRISPFAPFSHAVMVKPATKNCFQFAGASIERRTDVPDSFFWHVRISTDSGGLASGAWLKFKVRGGGIKIISGRRLIDSFGELVIGIPARDSLRSGVMLTARVTRGRRSAQLSTPIDLLPNRVNVRYYTESCQLVQGLTIKMIMKFYGNNRKALQCSGAVIANSKEVARFRTDLSGFCFIYLRPEKGKVYSIRLDLPLKEQYLVGVIPKIHPQGAALAVPKGVVRDSLTIGVGTTKADRSLRLLIFSDRGPLYAALLSMSGVSGSFKLPTAGWPAGIAHVVILSEQGDALCDSQIYVVPPSLNVSITSDSSKDHAQIKAEALVRALTEDSKPIHGKGALSYQRFEGTDIPLVERGFNKKESVKDRRPSQLYCERLAEHVCFMDC